MLIVCGNQQIASAQVPNSLAFPSANNNFLGAITNNSGTSEIDVDLYTGTGQVKIPICNIGSKELSIPISLSYTGCRGIKVQEYATSVGLGWMLNAGGNISRVVRGWPDERPQGYLGINRWGQKIAAAFANGTAMPTQVTGGENSSPTADGEADIFYIKTPFFATQFVFDENGVPVFSNSTGLKVIANNFFSSGNYANSNFTVIDEQGNQYFFGTSERESTTTKLYGTTYTFPTTWYLQRILTFDSKDNIYFSYTGSGSQDVYKHYQSTNTYNDRGCTKTDDNTTTGTVVDPKFVSAITTSTGQIAFTYARDRRDLLNSARLTTIQLKSTVGTTITTLQTYNLHYSYFGDPSADAETLRLKLDKITLFGNTTLTAAPLDYRVFTYNTTENLPSHSSSSFDYWGYYTNFRLVNGSTDPMEVPQVRQPHTGRTKANILTSVKDITGNTTQLNYELHSYQSSSGIKNAGGLRVSSIVRSLPSGDALTTSYNYDSSYGYSNGQILTESYANLVVVWGNWVVWQVMSETSSTVYDLNGNYIGYSSVKITEPNGGYTVAEFTNFRDFMDSYTYVQGYDQNSVPHIISSTSRAFKRGLSKSQTVYTATGKKVSQDVYNYSALTNTMVKAKSYHWLSIGYNICDNSQNNIFDSYYGTLVENYRPSQLVHREFDQINDARYVERTVNYAYADNKRLLRSMSANDSKGITQTKTFYYPEDVSTPGIPMLTSTEQTAMNSLINLNKTGAVVHESHTRNGVTTQVHNGYTSYALGIETKVFHTSAAEYKESTLLKKQYFDYDLATADLISTREENGKSTSWLYGYNNSYPIAKVVNAAASSSFTTYTGQTYGGSIQLVADQQQSATFTVPTAGNIVLELYEESGSTSWKTSCYYTLIGPANATGTLCTSDPVDGCDPDYYDITLPNMPAGTYTLFVNVSSSLLNSSASVSYFHPTINTVYTNTRQFFFEGFEQGNGNTNGGYTGLKSYNGNYTVTFQPTDGRSYKIQWWSYVNNAWKFNEADYVYPKTFNGLRIDDIRVFPADAFMTSYAHNPVVGATGETDPAGKSTFYEYDGLSRLNIVRDNERKIVKKYCYNFAGQSNGCALFTNTAQSGNFSKNNCPYGLGTPVTYPVPAGKYYSEISQADANQQAINDVNANGQSYANANGGCQTNFFVRLDRELAISYYDEYYSYENTKYYLRFFTNSAGTIPLTLQAHATVNVHYYTTHERSPNYNYYNNVSWPTSVYAGTSEHFITAEDNLDCYLGPEPGSFDCRKLFVWLDPGPYYTTIDTPHN